MKNFFDWWTGTAPRFYRSLALYKREVTSPGAADRCKKSPPVFSLKHVSSEPTDKAENFKNADELLSNFFEIKDQNLRSDACRKIITEYPNTPAAHFSQGYLFYMQKEYSKALAESYKALEMNPRHWPSYFMLATIFQGAPPFLGKEDNLQKARESWHEAAWILGFDSKLGNEALRRYCLLLDKYDEDCLKYHQRIIEQQNNILMKHYKIIENCNYYQLEILTDVPWDYVNKRMLGNAPDLVKVCFNNRHTSTYTQDTIHISKKTYGDKDTLHRVVAHETAHVVVLKLLKSKEPPPFNLKFSDEGLATLIGWEFLKTKELVLKKAHQQARELYKQGKANFEDMSNWKNFFYRNDMENSQNWNFQNAHNVSLDFLNYFEYKYGMESIINLLEHAGKDGFETAFKRVTGQEISSFFHEWHQYLESDTVLSR